MEIATEANETAIVVFQEDALNTNGDMLTQVQFSTEDVESTTLPDKMNGGTFLVPETLISQNSILGKDFVIRCTPCNKIFVSADGYNNHVQVKTSINSSVYQLTL